MDSIKIRCNLEVNSQLLLSNFSASIRGFTALSCSATDGNLAVTSSHSAGAVGTVLELGDEFQDGK
jgi:hypothetical protein